MGKVYRVVMVSKIKTDLEKQQKRTARTVTIDNCEVLVPWRHYVRMVWKLEARRDKHVLRLVKTFNQYFVFNGDTVTRTIIKKASTLPKVTA